MGKLKTVALISLGIKGEMPYPHTQRPCRAMHDRASDYLYVAACRGGGQMKLLLVSGLSYIGPCDDLYSFAHPPLWL